MMPLRAIALRSVVVLSIAGLSTAQAAGPHPGAEAKTVLAINDAYPHISKHGRLVFQSNRLGGTKLYSSMLDGTVLRQITTGPGNDVTPVWSPDGTSLAFASDRGGNEDIWIVRADGSDLRNVTNNPDSDSHPSWSPDGRRIVFCSTRGDHENDDLYIVNTDGSGLVRLTDNGLFWDTFPSFSPDGQKILFRRLLRQRTPEGTLINSEIMIMDAKGGEAINLSKNEYFDGWPAFSPDGRYIAFSSNREDYFQIFVMKADGSDVRQVVHSSNTDVRPQWLPGGVGLIFNRESEGRIELRRADF